MVPWLLSSYWRCRSSLHYYIVRTVHVDQVVYSRNGKYSDNILLWRNTKMRIIEGRIFTFEYHHIHMHLNKHCYRGVSFWWIICVNNQAFLKCFSWQNGLVHLCWRIDMLGYRHEVDMDVRHEETQSTTVKFRLRESMRELTLISIKKNPKSIFIIIFVIYLLFNYCK